MSNVWVPYFTWELMFVFIIENHSRPPGGGPGNTGEAIETSLTPKTTSGNLASRAQQEGGPSLSRAKQETSARLSHMTTIH